MKYLKFVIIIFGLFLMHYTLYAQDTFHYENLSLENAINIGLANNIALKADQVRIGISKSQEQIAKNEQFPEIGLHASYARITNLNQYESGGIFSNPTSYETYKALYDVSTEAILPIYHGGKLVNEIRKKSVEIEIQQLKATKNARMLKLAIVTNYLQIYHLIEQHKLMLNKLIEDTAIIIQVKALIQNGVVTENEVLRANLQLSNHSMLESTILTDISIAEHELVTLMSIPSETIVHIDPTSINTFNNLQDITLSKVMEVSEDQNDEINIAKKEVGIFKYDKKLTYSNYLPQINLKGDFAYKYPNYMFFPPEPYLYNIGNVGIDLKYSLSNLYTNRAKMKFADQKIQLQNLEVHHITEQVNHKVFAAHKKYIESSKQILIAKEAILQAKENYEIVRNKYVNQLSLITELMDADNAFLEAQATLISKNIDHQLKYYQLQYTIGVL